MSQPPPIFGGPRIAIMPSTKRSYRIRQFEPPFRPGALLLHLPSLRYAEVIRASLSLVTVRWLDSKWKDDLTWPTIQFEERHPLEMLAEQAPDTVPRQLRPQIDVWRSDGVVIWRSLSAIELRLAAHWGSTYTTADLHADLPLDYYCEPPLEDLVRLAKTYEIDLTRWPSSAFFYVWRHSCPPPRTLPVLAARPPLRLSYGSLFWNGEPCPTWRSTPPTWSATLPGSSAPRREPIWSLRSLVRPGRSGRSSLWSRRPACPARSRPSCLPRRELARS